MVDVIYKGDSTSCIIPVCGGTEDMRGKRFFAYVEEAARHFTHAHLVVADTLDAHNMAEEGGAMWEDAIAVARSQGGKWINQHMPVLLQHFPGLTLLRWDDIKADGSFQDRLRVSSELYRDSPFVRAYVDDVCSRYVDVRCQRAVDQGLIPKRDVLMSRSVAYMIEEIAGSAVYAGLYSGPAVYPGEYFLAPDIIQKHNRSGVDLTVPAHCKVVFDGQMGLKLRA